MDPQLSLGGPHPTPRNKTKREGPKVRMNPQRPTLAGMELQKEMSKGGVECTILAHIDTGTNPLSIQNKQHLH